MILSIMNRNIIFKQRIIGLKFISRFCSGNTPVKLSYDSYDQETPKENPQKSPIIFLHGVFDNKSNYISLAKSLNRLTKRTTITPDCRNHGDSPDAPEMSYQAMSEDVMHLTENLNIKQSILMGHSLGGGTGMFTALTNPHLIEKLVIIDANPIELGPSVHGLPIAAKTMASVNFQGLQTLSEAKTHADNHLSSLVKSSSARKLLIQNVREVSPGNFKWMMNLPVLMADLPKYIMRFTETVAQLPKKPFTKPTLFIGSDQSGWLRRELFPDIRLYFPNAEFMFIEGTGHYLHLQRSEEFLKITSEFINEDTVCMQNSLKYLQN